METNQINTLASAKKLDKSQPLQKPQRLEGPDRVSVNHLEAQKRSEWARRAQHEIPDIRPDHLLTAETTAPTDHELAQALLSK